MLMYGKNKRKCVTQSITAKITTYNICTCTDAKNSKSFASYFLAKERKKVSSPDIIATEGPRNILFLLSVLSPDWPIGSNSFREGNYSKRLKNLLLAEAGHLNSPRAVTGLLAQTTESSYHLASKTLQ